MVRLAAPVILLSVEKELVDDLGLEEVIDSWARKKKIILTVDVVYQFLHFVL